MNMYTSTTKEYVYVGREGTEEGFESRRETGKGNRVSSVSYRSPS